MQCLPRQRLPGQHQWSSLQGELRSCSVCFSALWWPSHMSEHPNQTTTRKKSFLVCYLMPLKWQTSMLDSASDHAGSFSNQCLSEQKLVLTILTVRIHLDVWPSVKVCRALSEIFAIFWSEKWVSRLELLTRRSESPTLVHHTPSESDTHRSVQEEGGCGAECENCAWGAESWASTRMSDECTIHRDRFCCGWGSLIFWCVRVWLICVFHSSTALTQPTATTWAFPCKGKLN